ncbi:large ribosomal subunit protein uL1m [Anabrus simplex]|uniref:large ribosomal subunit protein uL1m n=1 Tax=Anabrus simplex TaxID=316456 RepID=UPI0034DD7510
MPLITSMASSFSGILTKFTFSGAYCRWGHQFLLPTLKLNEVLQVRYAARKGTREKRKKKAQSAKVEKKIETVPFYLRGKGKLKVPTTKRRIEDFWKSDPVDNVWIGKYHKWRIYSFAEAVECHRETHHPTIYNVPDAPLNAFIELDMRAPKKNKFVDNFKRVVHIPYPFDLGDDRSVLVFCKSPELQKMALEAGATLCGGTELIKDVQKGEVAVQDFQFVVAHPEILPELVSVRGLMKRNFPTTRNGTLGADVAEMVSRFKFGIKYASSSDENEKDYGWIDTSIGKLDMDVSHLEANFIALLKDVDSLRPKREGPFITRCLLISAPSVERLKVNLEPYLGVEKDQDIRIEEEEEEEVEEEEEEEGKEKRESSAVTSGQ